MPTMDATAKEEHGFKAKVSSPEAWIALGLASLFFAIFCGNAFIAVGHGAIVVGLLMGLFRRSHERLDWSGLRPSSWWLIAFVLAAVISVAVNWGSMLSPDGALKKLRHFVVFILLLLLPNLRKSAFVSMKYRSACILLWWVGLVASVIVGGISFFFGEKFPLFNSFGHEGRLSGFYGQVMTFAYILQFSVLALAAFVVYPGVFRKLTRLPWWSVFPVGLIAAWGQYFAYSRGAILGVAVGLLAMALMHSKRLTLVVLLVGVLAGGYAYKDSWAGGDTPLYFRVSDPVRTNQWKTAMLAFIDNPVFGLGYKDFEVKCLELKEKFQIEPAYLIIEDGVSRYEYFKGHAHNNWLEALASTGALGGIACAGFCLSWLREAWQYRRTAGIFVPLVLAFIVSGCFENTFYDSEVMSCIMLIYFCSQIAFDRQSQGREPEPVKLPT